MQNSQSELYHALSVLPLATCVTYSGTAFL